MTRPSVNKTAASADEFRLFSREFFEPSSEIVAKQLLGHWLVRQSPGGPCVSAIIETEAYLHNDPACHAFSGETKRNQVMWGPAGHCYVYFIYGNHWCFNVVCRLAGIAEALLVRAVEPISGQDWMLRQRFVTKPEQLTNGPGKLCEALAIGRDMNGVDLCNVKSPAFLARNPDLKSFLRTHGPVVTTTRVGIVKAAAKPLRFYLKGSRYVSHV